MAIYRKYGDDENSIIFRLKSKSPSSPIAQCFDHGRFRALIAHHFLPREVDTRIKGSYINFTTWHVMSSIATSASGVLATQSLLYAVGLGAGSIPAAAALNWVGII